MRLITFLALLAVCQSSFAFRVAFYNIENLFDAKHDEGKQDWEFLPLGHVEKKNCSKVTNRYFRRRCVRTNWTEEHVKLKIRQLAKVIVSAGRPEFIGLQEVENWEVLQRLGDYLGNYQAYLIEGDDKRGIDVGALVRKDAGIKVIAQRNHKVPAYKKPTRPIYEIEIEKGDQKYSIFVNHWPSQGSPTAARTNAAKTLAQVAFERISGGVHVIAGGDFNVVDADRPHPTEVTLKKDLSTVGGLTDMYPAYLKSKARDKAYTAIGTYFYIKEMKWNRVDRILVSKSLVSRPGFGADPESFRVHTPKVTRKSFTYTYRGYSKGTVIQGVPDGFFTFKRDGRLVAGGASDHFMVSVNIR